MTQQPPPFLAYSTPADEPVPACIQTISIIGICLGSLTLIARVGGIFIGVALTSIARNAGSAVRYSAYSVASSLVFAGFAAWLLIASIGCMKRMEWARQALLLYSVVYPIALIVEFGFSVLMFTPAMTRLMSHTNTTTPNTPVPITTWMLAAIVVFQILYVMVLLVLPTFILIYMRSPRVRAVFS